jgi:hypothetical protein
MKHSNKTGKQYSQSLLKDKNDTISNNNSSKNIDINTNKDINPLIILNKSNNSSLKNSIKSNRNQIMQTRNSKQQSEHSLI